MTETLAEAAARIAATQVGVEERPRGSNSGPEVDRYLAAVHLPPGNSWCAAFVCWSIIEATKLVGGPPQFKFSGSCLHLLALNTTLVIPVPGLAHEPCVFIIDHGGGHGHCGYVVGVDQAGVMETIEGNTNPEGHPNGYGCFRRHSRHVSDVKGFLRIG